MISNIRLSDVYFCKNNFNSNTVDTTIKLIRNAKIEVSLDGKVLSPSLYTQIYIAESDVLRVRFFRRQTGYLCVFRNSNASNVTEFGAEKSRGQNENFFDSLVEYVQDEAYVRGADEGIYSLGFSRDGFNVIPLEGGTLGYLNTEGKKTTLNGKAYKQKSDFNINFNSYNGSIASGLPSEGIFGDRRKDTVEVDVSVPFVQDIETGLSIDGKGYTLIKEINIDADDTSANNNRITSLVLYRRMLDPNAETYNVQKAMIGTTATTAKIYHGNDTYTCTVEHKYDLIILRLATFNTEHNFNSVFTGIATVAIDLGGEPVQLYIENNGIVLKDFT